MGYDPIALQECVKNLGPRVMAVVAYAGDSRTQTIDDVSQVAEIVRRHSPDAWLHADACWGLLAMFSDKLRTRLDGIQGFDSVTVDPHKVLGLPYAVSALLLRRPDTLRAITSHSDLIMRGSFSLGQVTPFVGSRSWLGLKLLFALSSAGRIGLAQMAENQVDRAKQFSAMLDLEDAFARLNDPDLSAVAFVWLPPQCRAVTLLAEDVALVNTANEWIHRRMQHEGCWYLHQFPLRDQNEVISGRQEFSALRFMGINPAINETHMSAVLSYVESLGRSWAQQQPN